MKRSRIEPGPGQESVWDYPRPPELQRSSDHLRVEFNGASVAETRAAFRVLETSHPPVYYISPSDIDMSRLFATERETFCEYKGRASYYGLQVEERIEQQVGWYYSAPTAGYEELKDHVAFYPSRVDACWVNDERVQAQAGDFYGGWITTAVVGPFKGEPGTWGW